MNELCGNEACEEIIVQSSENVAQMIMGRSSVAEMLLVLSNLAKFSQNAGFVTTPISPARCRMNRKQRRLMDKQVKSVPKVQSSVLLREMFAQAAAAFQAGKLSEAEALCAQILSFDRRHADALHLQGVIASQRGRLEEAVALIGKAIAVDGAAAHYHANIGNLLRLLGRRDEAQSSLRRSLQLDPAAAAAHGNLGIVLKDLGQTEEAGSCFRMAADLAPASAEAQCNLATFLKDIGRPAEAIPFFQRAIGLKADFALAHTNLGTAYRLLGQSAKAFAAYRHALVVNPAAVEVFFNIGNLRRDQGCLGEALAAFRRATQINPDFGDGYYNEALSCLMAGDYDLGWKQFEWRWRGGIRNLQPRPMAKPRWAGEDLGGRTILLYAEQGLGDSIQFCRYAALVAAAGGRVILEMPKSLRALMSTLAGPSAVVATGDPLPEFDCHCPLMSLPAVLGTRLDTVPASLPYLSADPARVATWRGRLPAAGIRIGIAWQGRPTYSGDQGRSAPLAAFAPLAAVPGVRLISLQKGHGLEQLDDLPAGMTVHSLGADFDGGDDAFLDTAAVMMSLDLVVCVDTAIGHLAGALGRPVWLALGRPAHWIWMLDRQDSPWYPGARLFRQDAAGDWTAVFTAMAAALPGSGCLY